MIYFLIKLHLNTFLMKVSPFNVIPRAVIVSTLKLPASISRFYTFMCYVHIFDHASKQPEKRGGSNHVVGIKSHVFTQYMPM